MDARFAVAVLLTTVLGLTHWRVEAQAQPGFQASSDESQDPLYGGGDGLSIKTALVIRSAGQLAGVRSEYAWIAKHYPGSKRLSQALTTAKDHEGKSYDIITIRTSAGVELKLWFDITAMMQ